MDKTELRLGIAGQLRKFERILQPKFGPKQAQTVEELDGFWIGHSSL
jgi:hypothetical protein